MHITLLFGFACFVGPAIAAPGRVPMRRAISPANPLIILPSTRRGPAATRGNVCPELRPFVALQTGAMHRAEQRHLLEHVCQTHMDANSPLVLHVRTHWPMTGPDAYDGKVTPPEVLDGLLARYTNIVAVIIAEQYAFTKEQRSYFCKALELADRHGVYCIFDAGWHSAADWAELSLDGDVLASVLKHRRAFVPMWEMNITEAMYTEHAQLMGLWLAGHAAHWGANPQTWMWGEAGFGKLDEFFGYRCQKAGGYKKGLEKGKEVRRHFPFYGQAVLLPALTGASVFWIGGEAGPHCWDMDNKPSHWWRETLEPAFRAVVEWRLIPTREQLLPHIKRAITNPDGWPYVVDSAVAHEGARSLRIEAGAGRSTRLSWANDEFLTLEPGRAFTLSAWVRCQDVGGAAYVDVAWFDGTRWTHRRSVPSKGAHDWREHRVAFTLPRGYQFGLIHLAVDGAEGTAWFDDLSLVDSDGKPRPLANPSFEALRAGGNRPVGWRPGGGYGPGDLHTCRRGINALWHSAYGVEHTSEFIPNTATMFPMVCLPSAPAPGDALARRLWHAPVSIPLPASPGRTTHEAAPSAFVFDRGDTIFIANSHENIDQPQAFDVAWRGMRLQGEVGVHHYLLLKQEQSGAIRLLVEGRKGRSTTLRIAAAKPIHLRSTGEGIDSSFDAASGALVLRFDHAKRKLVKVP